MRLRITLTLFLGLLPAIGLCASAGESSVRDLHGNLRWVKRGDVVIAESLNVNDPVFIYITHSGERWRLSGSLAGIEKCLNSELLESPPPIDLVEFLEMAFSMPSGRPIDAFLIREYGRALEDRKAIDQERRKRKITTIDDTATPLARTMDLLRPYISLTGCTVENGTIRVRYYILKTSGDVFEYVFEFTKAWTVLGVHISTRAHLDDIEYLPVMH